jgi:hypothetical protein
MRKLLGIGVVWLVTSTALLAADFWTDKDFASWSDKEVEKMLTDSPWAKKATIVIGGLSTASDSRFFIESNPFQGGIGGDIDALANPECGGGQFQRIRRVKATVTWASALPIKLALVRRLIRMDEPIPAEDQEILTREDPFYTVTVVGLPAPFYALEPLLDAVMAQTMLRRGDKAPIAPANVQLFRNEADQSVLVEFKFPKTEALTMDDADVEFVTTLGTTNEIRERFKLDEMVFADQLAL